MSKKIFFFIVIFSFLIRFVFLYANNQRPNSLNFNLSQDNYVGYAQYFQNQTLNQPNNTDTRLFPGYPLFMLFVSTLLLIPLVYSGILINLLSLAGSILIFWHLTKNKLATILFCFIPPIWFIAPIKIATEPLTVFLLLFAMYLFFKKNFLMSGIILGLASDVRLISICLLLSLAIVSYKKIKDLFPLIIGFLTGFLPFFIYNYVIFNDFIYQFKLYPKVGGTAGSAIGFIQIFKDISRTIDWHQYQILFSGITYILFSFIATFILYKYRNSKLIYKICFLWSIFSLLFIFSYGPNPILEEFRRFVIPFLPALILGITAPINTYKKIFLKLTHYVRKI